jgi:hypothetical protein
MRKLILGTILLLAVAALAVVPAMASASTTEYGTCEAAAGHAKEGPCKAGEKFSPFTEAHVAVTGKLTSSHMSLQVRGLEGIECKTLSAIGYDWNRAGVGHGQIIYAFEGCIGTGVLREACGASKPLNGDGIWEGTFTNEVSSGGLSVKLVPPLGEAFDMICGEYDFGPITGSTTGSQPEASNVLHFSKVGSLKAFWDEETELTGEIEFETLAGKKVYI